MKLLTKEIKAQLIKNYEKQKKAQMENISLKPVVKFFGGASCTWLITEMHDFDLLYGLCDLGLGCPELGYVSLMELENMRLPPFGLRVERDKYFTASKTLHEYYNESLESHRIVA